MRSVSSNKGMNGHEALEKKNQSLKYRMMRRQVIISGSWKRYQESVLVYIKLKLNSRCACVHEMKSGTFVLVNEESKMLLFGGEGLPLLGVSAPSVGIARTAAMVSSVFNPIMVTDH